MNRPMMFYQDAWGEDSVDGGPRIRIVYPTGLVEWATLYGDGSIIYHFDLHPCWYEEFGIADSAEQAVDLLTIYDADCGYLSMEFLGYL